MDGGGVDPAGAYVQRLFANFLDEFRREEDEEEAAPFYVRALAELREAGLTTLHVSFAHLVECVAASAKLQRTRSRLRELPLTLFDAPPPRFDDPLAHEAVSAQFYRFEPFLRKAVQARRPVLPAAARLTHPFLFRTSLHTTSRTTPPTTAGRRSSSSRVRGASHSAPLLAEPPNPRAVVNLPRALHLRELRTGKIGQLVAFSGTVTRTSEVRPELLFGTFTCGDCGSVVRDVEQQCKYTTPAICPNTTCNNRRAPPVPPPPLHAHAPPPSPSFS